MLIPKPAILRVWGMTVSTARVPLLALALFSLPTQAQTTINVTGTPVPGMASFDTLMTSLMSKYNIPGATLAVAQGHRLVLSHGYGKARHAIDAQPDTLFRVASISKPITAAAIL